MAINVNDLGKVYITGAGYVERPFVTSRDSIGWNETVWGGTLNRSRKFTLENINDVDIGQVAQCTITFKFLKIEDFIVLQELLRERHLLVKYFDIDYGQWVTHEMAITGNERKKIYSYGKNIIGMQDLTVKFVATNLDNDYVDRKITYNPNGAVGAVFTRTYEFAEQVSTLTQAQAFYLYPAKTLASWNTEPDGSGKTYLINQSITLWNDLTLYAIWE